MAEQTEKSNNAKVWQKRDSSEWPSNGNIVSFDSRNSPTPIIPVSKQLINTWTQSAFLTLKRDISRWQWMSKIKWETWSSPQQTNRKLESAEVPKKGIFLSVFKIWKIHYLQVYKDGQPILRSIASLGVPWHRTPAISRRKIPWSTKRVHISSLYPINKKTWERGWARMEYAIHIRWNIFIHSGVTTWSPLSHGCVRLPMWIAKQVYNLVNQNKKNGIYVEIKP